MLFGRRKVRVQKPKSVATAQPRGEVESPVAAIEPPTPDGDAPATRLQAEAERAPPPPPFVAGETLPAAEVGADLTIDCTAVAQNWRTLASRGAPADCAAVVKADAYGCGIEPITSSLAAAGCNTFFVAHIAEARRVRAAAPNAVIYVLNGIAPGSAHCFAEIDARPVIGNLGELTEWDAFRTVHSWHGGAALHFDTGMNRLGLPIEEAASLAGRVRSLPNHGIALVMSHLACADEPRHPLNPKQIRDFQEIRIMFRGVPASLANSAGIFLDSSAHFDLVRPGIALYGANPTVANVNPMRPVVELRARMLQARIVPEGSTVGYGATWTAKRVSRIAIVSIGYADGYSRPIGSSDARRGGEAVVQGRRCPIIGRVSMDLLAIDITELTKDVHRGDWVTLLGEGIGVDEMAGWARTINYDVLTRLGHRFHRVWKH
jgi:alanine racemase